MYPGIKSVYKNKFVTLISNILYVSFIIKPDNHQPRNSPRLRIYERKGLLEPSRTGGGSRRYSQHDIARLHRIAELTNAGLNLEGVRRVMELEDEVSALRAELALTHSQLQGAVEATHRQYRRELVPFGRLPAIRPPR